MSEQILEMPLILDSDEKPPMTKKPIKPPPPPPASNLNVVPGRVGEGFELTTDDLRSRLTLGGRVTKFGVGEGGVNYFVYNGEPEDTEGSGKGDAATTSGEVGGSGSGTDRQTDHDDRTN